MRDVLDLKGFSVLVTDEHYKHTLGAVRHLGRRGARVTLLANNTDSLVCTSRYCHRTLPIEGSGNEALLRAAGDALSASHFDLVLPIGYKSALALAQWRDAQLPQLPAQLAATDKIQLAANKNCMAKLAERVGVPVPRTLVTSSREELCQFAERVAYPVVVKSQRETSGRSVSYARNQKELLDLWSQTAAKNASHEELPLLQEYIPGYGCGFFATYQQGVCKRVFMHRRVREYPATGGVSTCAQSFYHPDLEESGRRILDALGWHGVAMAEFRCDSRDNAFKLIEVNPKFWGSLDLALAAGADFPGDLCRMALGEDLQFTAGYNRALRYHWPLSVSGEIYHLKSRPQSFLEVAWDFFDPRVKSNIWLSDFAPALRELRSLFSAVLAARPVK